MSFFPNSGFLTLPVSRGSTTPPAPTAAPVNLAPPEISGTAQVDETLTATLGAWINRPTAYTRQWYRDGVAISGATGATYAQVEADVGALITHGVVASNAIGPSDEALSAPVGPVEAAPVEPVLPGSIADLTATAQSDTEVLLEWTPATDATSHQYRVDGGTWIACDDNTGEQLVSGLTADTEYDFEVRGVNADGNGPASNTATATTGATSSASSLTAPVLALAVAGDTYPPQLSVSLDETYEEGDQIALYSASSLAGTYTLLDTATLDATAISTGTLTIADLSEISSPAQTWFKAYGTRSGAPDSLASNVIKHGDVTGPEITSDATQSQGEYEPMAYVITADEDIERIEIIGGTDAALLEVAGTTIRLTGNADLNYNAKSSYAFNFRTYDYGGNFTDTNAALNVSDEIPDAPVFVDDIGVERETAQSSNTYTLTGVTAGKNVPFTISLGTGCTYTLGAVSGLTAPSGTMQLGDTLSIQGTASDSYSTAIDTVFGIDGLTDTYSITTMADPEAASLIFRQQGVMNYNYGTTCPGLTGDSIAIEDGDKVVIALFCTFNGAAGDFVVTSVSVNGGTVAFTEVGEAFGAGSNNVRKVYLFYADTSGVTTISDLNVTVSGSTQDIGYSINSVQNAPAGAPADSHKNIRSLSGEDPVSVDGGLSATDTRAMMICAQLSANPGKQFIWTGAIEQDEKSESGRLISTAHQAPGQGASVTLKGGSPDGVGYTTLSQVNALWGV